MIVMENRWLIRKQDRVWKMRQDSLPMSLVVNDSSTTYVRVLLPPEPTNATDHL